MHQILLIFCQKNQHTLTTQPLLLAYFCSKTGLNQVQTCKLSWTQSCSGVHRINRAQTSKMRSCSRRFISSSRSRSLRFSSSCLCNASCFFWLMNASSSCQPVVNAFVIVILQKYTNWSIFHHHLMISQLGRLRGTVKWVSAFGLSNNKWRWWV